MPELKKLNMRHVEVWGHVCNEFQMGVTFGTDEAARALQKFYPASPPRGLSQRVGLVLQFVIDHHDETSGACPVERAGTKWRLVP